MPTHENSVIYRRHVKNVMYLCNITCKVVFNISLSLKMFTTNTLKWQAEITRDLYVYFEFESLHVTKYIFMSKMNILRGFLN